MEPRTDPRRREDVDVRTEARATSLPGPLGCEGLSPLWGVWELWCELPTAKSRRGDLGLTWLDEVRSIGMFDTAEGFWTLHNCLKDLSVCEPGVNLYMLRKNVPPMWEHEANRRGGKWSVHFSNADRQQMDDFWMAVRLAAIGEAFPVSDVEICGVVACRRKGGGRVSVWTRSAQDADAQHAIAVKLRTLLPATYAITYTEHTTSLAGNRGGSPLQLAYTSRPVSPEQIFDCPASGGRSPTSWSTPSSPVAASVALYGI
jgi:translation initiation factor 4E